MKKIVFISICFGFGVFVGMLAGEETFALSATVGGISTELAVLILLALLVKVKKEKNGG